MTMKTLNSTSSLMTKVKPKNPFLEAKDLYFVFLVFFFVDEAVLVYEKKQGMIDMYHTEGMQIN